MYTFDYIDFTEELNTYRESFGMTQQRSDPNTELTRSYMYILNAQFLLQKK